MSEDRVLQSNHELSAGSRFITSFFAMLNQENIPYCVVGSNVDQLPIVPENDLDIVVSGNSLSAVEQVIIEVARANGLSIAQRVQYESCAYSYVLYITEVGQARIVRIDISLGYVLFGDGRLFISVENILGCRRLLIRNNELYIYLPSAQSEFTYYTMKKVYKGDFDEVALRHLRKVFEEDASGCSEFLYRYWPRSLAQQIKDAILTMDLTFFTKNSVSLRRILYANFPARTAYLLIAEYRRWLQRALNPTGFVVAILGPDGSGKSTLLNKLVSRTAALGQQRRQFHLWPRSGWKVNQDAPVTDPHARAPRGIVSSLFKIVYLVWRYNQGWFAAVFIPYRRTAMIWFDRYYHDMLADPYRYRMSAPAWLVRLFGRLIPKPDLFLILDVRPEIVRARKIEVSEAESQRQFHAYRSLARELPNAVRIDANGTPDEVATSCERAVVGAMARRLGKRMGWKGEGGDSA